MRCKLCNDNHSPIVLNGTCEACILQLIETIKTNMELLESDNKRLETENKQQKALVERLEVELNTLEANALKRIEELQS